MACCGKNQYQIEVVHEISKERILDLFTCYQPCIGVEAVCFYLTLLSESRIHSQIREHTRLCKITGMDIKQIDAARIKCEQFALIRTYISSDESSYFYEVHAPLSAKDYLQHDVFGRLYLSRIGAKETEVTSASVFHPQHSYRNLVEISASFDASLLKNWDAAKEVEYAQVQPEQLSVYPQRSGFDMDLFLSISTNLTFPYQARTQKNLNLIADLGALYGIKEERMRIVVGHCINNATEQLNTDMLKKMASYEQPELKHEPKNKYDMPPVLFLQNIQGGVNVTQIDKRILEYLVTDMHFSSEVTNVLVEYVLSVSENRLVRSFVESVAATWLRNKVNTVEDALKMAENKPVRRTSAKSNRKASMPKYLESNTASSELSDEERELLLQKLSQLEE